WANSSTNQLRWSRIWCWPMTMGTEKCAGSRLTSWLRTSSPPDETVMGITETNASDVPAGRKGFGPRRAPREPGMCSLADMASFSSKCTGAYRAHLAPAFLSPHHPLVLFADDPITLAAGLSQARAVGDGDPPPPVVNQAGALQAARHHVH